MFREESPKKRRANLEEIEMKKHRFKEQVEVTEALEQYEAQLGNSPTDKVLAD